MKTITPVPCLKDNYAWLLSNAYGQAAVVDPGEYDSVSRHLQSTGTRLESILVTHLHSDHTDGIGQLLRDYPTCRVWGPFGTPGVTDVVREGSKVALFEDDLVLSTWHTPGHCREHVSFIGEGSIFCGDTLFSGGCGRATDGRPEDLFYSIRRISELPASTLLYCGHEYTLPNLRFAKLLIPGDGFIEEYTRTVESLREAGKPSIPTTLATEQRINLFLRCNENNIQRITEHLSAEYLGTEVSTFLALRQLKDRGPAEIKLR